MESYKFLQEAETAKVPKIELRAVFIVDKAVMPDFYDSVLADEHKLPYGVIVTLKDGADYQSVVGDGESVFSASVPIDVGGSGPTEDQLLPTGGSTGQVPKKQADGSVAWANDNNSTYTAMSASEATGGTGTTARTITPAVLAGAIAERLPAAVTWSNISGKPAVVAEGATAAAARTAIGAGTSSLTLAQSQAGIATKPAIAALTAESTLEEVIAALKA